MTDCLIIWKINTNWYLTKAQNLQNMLNNKCQNVHYNNIVKHYKNFIFDMQITVNYYLNKSYNR